MVYPRVFSGRDLPRASCAVECGGISHWTGNGQLGCLDSLERAPQPARGKKETLRILKEGETPSFFFAEIKKET